MNMNPPIPNRPEDEIDRLFAAYFRAERPARWPAAPRPWANRAQPAAVPTGDPSTRSRWALAASVALLIGGYWYLSGQATDGRIRPGFNPDGGGADLSHIKKAAPKVTPKVP